MMSNREVHDHYLDLDGRTLDEIAENFKDCFPEHSDLTVEEVLLQQESVMLWIQANSMEAGTSDHTQSQSSGQEGEYWQRENIESQLALDEALARSLQDLGEDFDNLYLVEESNNATESIETIHAETPSRVMNQDISQDDIDPDNMSYEQLQFLGEAVGHESKGLPHELISQLPTFKYRSGLFSKKKKEECVICCMVYKSGDRLSILPCAHQYHSDCIKHWLKISKTCPICQKEVVDD